MDSIRPGEAFVPIAQHVADDLALQVGLRAAEVARDDWELFQLGIFNQIFFFHIRQRTDDDVFAVVAYQLGRHSFEFAAVKHIQEHGGKDVVAVVSQGDFGAAQFFCGAVEDAAAQAAAQRTSRFAFVQHAFNGGVGVFFDDFVRHADAFEIGRQYFFGETRLLLVEIDGDQLEINRCAGLKLAQNV